MKEYKKQFIDFLIKNESLTFGEFTLKSGRISPYFLNTGKLHSGKALHFLGKYYAEALNDNIDSYFTTIFGPAYKGIPLAVATTQALFTEFNINSDFAFNRKEAKAHGDKGLIVGKKITSADTLIIVDDVITAGTAIRESLELIRGLGNPHVKAIIVSVDRMERGTGDLSAVQQIEQDHGIYVFPIVTINEIVDYLRNYRENGNAILTDDLFARMNEYREKYGVN